MGLQPIMDGTADGKDGFIRRRLMFKQRGDGGGIKARQQLARHVGHANTTTTAGYVTNLGNRPQRTAQTAAQLLDHPPDT
mgnify:CR=1 FL=1